MAEGGTNDPNTILGTTGNDTINAGSGNDTVYGGAGNDVINGQADTDIIYGGSGNDTILGGAGTDEIYGGSGDDNLNGNNEADRLIGGFGNDILTAGSGQPVVDTFVFLSSYDGNDTIIGFSAEDKLDFSAMGITSTDVSSTVVNSNTIISVDADGNPATVELTITLLGYNAALQADDFIF